MAKEMMIVFVYSTGETCSEEDDPADSLIYFHPAWVSQTQKLALVGQLMGVNQFLTNLLSPPSLICLQGGKFVIKQFGTYILAIGTDRNIQDWILERRGDILESLLKFFHCDFKTILITTKNDKNKFVEKVYQIFETYLPILQYNANLFSNIPLLIFPKSVSNIFLEAMQVLQYCQETKGILRGAIFYNNKVVASQFDSDITKQLVITDPYRIKIPADNISTDFALPAGVQLFNVYMPQKYFQKMVRETNLERNYSQNLDSVTKKIQRKNFSKSTGKDQPLMKRENSRIFTVPEDVELDADHYRNNKKTFSSPLHTTAYSSPAKKIDESKIDKLKYQHPLTPSVCSTPLKDINRVLHGFAVSICSGSDEPNTKSQTNTSDNNKEEIINAEDDVPSIVKEALRCKRLNKLKNPTVKEKVVIKNILRSLSLPNLQESQLFSKEVQNNDEQTTKGLSLKKYFTITDPLFPVFRSDGLPVSQIFYEQYISTHYQNLDKNVTKSTMGNFESSSNFKAKKDLGIKETKGNGKSEKLRSLDLKMDNKSKGESYRRSMSLPIKPLNIIDNDDRRKSTTDCSGLFEIQKKKLDGLQLTPLMSKLSLLADERTSGFCSRDTTPSEYKDFCNFSTSKTHLLKSRLETISKDDSSDIDNEFEEDFTFCNKQKKHESYEKCELFLCGHQNMILFLLMENGTANDSELIEILWDMCRNIFDQLEMRLHKSLEPLPSNGSKELYSVLSINSEWDTVHRSGLWGVTDLDIVSSIHDRFIGNHNLTDVIIRTDDTVVYGNKCGKTEVLYQQAIPQNSVGGLPPPTDLMGTIPLKAKRRLERDHSILLL